jgi:hypothetical protein
MSVLVLSGESASLAASCSSAAKPSAQRDEFRAAHARKNGAASSCAPSRAQRDAL